MVINRTEKGGRVPPIVQLFDLLTGKIKTHLIYTAAKLGIADLLTKPKPISELATITNTDEKSLYRIMRALANMGIFKERKEKKFSSHIY